MNENLLLGIRMGKKVTPLPPVKYLVLVGFNSYLIAIEKSV